MNAEMQAQLREPFPPELIGHLPRAGLDIEFVGHGPVRDRLLQVDPEWTWEPFATDERGAPLFERDANGYPVGLWIRLTIGGVTRPGYGSVDSGKSDPEKELIGDALRNSAMSFGVALDLWIKQTDTSAGGRESAPARRRGASDSSGGTGGTAASPIVGELTDQINKIKDVATRRQAMKAFTNGFGSPPVVTDDNVDEARQLIADFAKADAA